MKQRKPNKQQRELKAMWEQTVKKHSRPLELGAKAKSIKVASSEVSKIPRLLVPSDRRQDIKSLQTHLGDTALPKTKVYTGDKMLGISQMAKSNAVPVFSKEEIVDINRMRRG